MSVENRVLSLTISSWVDGSIQFDLSHLFDMIPQGSLGYFRRKDWLTDDPFTFSSSSLTLLLDEDLSVFAGINYRIIVTYHEPADGAAPSNDDPMGIFHVDSDTGEVSFNQNVTLQEDTTYLVVFRAHETDNLDYDTTEHSQDKVISLTIQDSPIASSQEYKFVENLHYLDKEILLDVDTFDDANVTGFSLVNNHRIAGFDNAFEIDANTGEISFIPGPIFFDYERDPRSYDLTVKIDFSDGQSFQHNFTFNVLDADWIDTDLPYWNQNPITADNTFATDNRWARIYQGGDGNDTFNSRGQADVYVPGHGNDIVNLQNDNVMQTIVYRFDSSGSTWTAEDGNLTINNFKRADENGVAGDRLLLIDTNQNNPYRSMDAIFRALSQEGDSNKMTYEAHASGVAGSGFEVFRYVIKFGQPNNNNTITINFAEPIDQDVFDSRRNELDYGDYDHKVSHVLFGDTGFLLDPYYDSKVVIFDDVI